MWVGRRKLLFIEDSRKIVMITKGSVGIADCRLESRRFGWNRIVFGIVIASNQYIYNLRSCYLCFISKNQKKKDRNNKNVKNLFDSHVRFNLSYSLEPFGFNLLILNY